MLDDPREISVEEQIEINNALSKWYPTIIQTYNTSILDMMSSSVKKGIVHGVVVFIIISIFLLFEVYFKVFNMKFQKHPMILVIFLVIILVIVGITVYGQYIKNENLKLVLSLTKRGATKYDYESSDVISSKLSREAIINSGGRSDIGGSIIGGLTGYKLGNMRRRR